MASSTRASAGALLACLLAVGGPAWAQAGPEGSHPTRPAAPPPPDPGLPQGVAEAARRAPPPLPTPPAWPFAEAFPRTSGTGRVHDGAVFWSDFLYDDDGAISSPSLRESPGAWTFGTYEYTEEAHAGNGADVFRAAIGLDDTSTWWRVDWSTLVEPTVPVAAFALDRDGAGGAAVAWPGGSGLRAAGVDAALVVSGTGAWWHDLEAGTVTAVGDLGGAHAVELASRSFVVRLPRSAFEPGGTSVAHLAAGLADAEGDGFLALGTQHRHLPGQPNVYNVAFRDYEDEPAANNFWFEQTQATVLTTPGADVSAFALEVDWARLAAREREPEPLVRGWSNRWYVSSVELGPGRVTGVETSADGEPNYLGRVQPYGLYVPAAHDGSTALPLTWILHSFTINHNQYSATMPRLIQGACEDRGAYCVTTLGRGPDGGYRQEAELDLWEVWADVAATFPVDHERVTMGGYSMGGFGTFNLALDHPDLFAGIFILASAANEDLPRLENLRWTPYYHAHGVHDQLVPYLSEALPTVDELDRLGYRHRFDTYPTKDHVVWSLEDDLEFAAAWLAEEDRHVTTDPGHITYRWFPHEVDAALGIGASGAWWLRQLVARDPSAAEARVEARSLAQPPPEVTPVRSRTPLVDSKGSPVVRQELVWEAGDAPAPRPRLELTLANVGSGSVALDRAGVAAAPGSEVAVTTDGAVALSLDGVPAGTAVLLDGAPVGVAGGGQEVVVEVAEGEHLITFAAGAPGGPAGGPASAGGAPGTGGAPTSLPATGGGAGLAALAVVAVLMSTGSRRRG